MSKRGVYIHIPFCKNICSYCDFPKIYYHKKYINDYLLALEKEIEEKYLNDEVDSIYIGGGTPSTLSLEELELLFKILTKIKRSKNLEFTFESNIEDIDFAKLKLLKENGVNRISFGMQSNNPKILHLLNRQHEKDAIKEVIANCKEVGIKNISVDLIYGVNNETITDLKEDLELLISLNITHISCYSLILEPHTILYINKYTEIDEDIDYQMYNLIEETLTKNGYQHYEISNYAKMGFQSKHNLKYWDNLEYYGFGMGAVGYINNVRYSNTKNINNYLNFKFTKEKIDVTLKEQQENFFILGLRKIEGVNITEFSKIFNVDPFKIFALKRLITENKLILKDNYLSIPKKYRYLSNSILIEFLN